VTATFIAKSLSLQYVLTEIDGIERVGKIITKIMVCAPSNSATDLLALSLKNAGCNVLRVFSKKMESSLIRDDISGVCLHLITKSEKE